MRARMEGANLAGVRTEGADLSHARMDGANLWGARMKDVDLIGASMEEASLWQARMEGANLMRARLQGADLSEARMEGAKLHGTRLQAANLGAARIEGADIYSARIDELTGLVGATTFGAALRSVDMSAVVVFEDFLKPAFGDGTVKLPDGYVAGEGVLAHWSPRDDLSSTEFEKLWHAWQVKIGYRSPDDIP